MEFHGSADEKIDSVVTYLLAFHWNHLDDLARLVEGEPGWLNAALGHLGGVGGDYLTEVEANTRMCPEGRGALCERIRQTVVATKARNAAIEENLRREERENRAPGR